MDEAFHAFADYSSLDTSLKTKDASIAAAEKELDQQLAVYKDQAQVLKKPLENIQADSSNLMKASSFLEKQKLNLAFLENIVSSREQYVYQADRRRW